MKTRNTVVLLLKRIHFLGNEAKRCDDLLVLLLKRILVGLSEIKGSSERKYHSSGYSREHFENISVCLFSVLWGELLLIRNAQKNTCISLITLHILTLINFCKIIITF